MSVRVVIVSLVADELLHAHIIAPHTMGYLWLIPRSKSTRYIRIAIYLARFDPCRSLRGLSWYVRRVRRRSYAARLVVMALIDSEIVIDCDTHIYIHTSQYPS